MSVTKIFGQGLTALPAVVCLVLALNGCNKPSVATVENGRLRVTLDDYFLSPQEITVLSGKPLLVTVRNVGATPHSFRIRRGGRDFGGSGALAPKQSESIRLRLRAGEYRIFSGLSNDETLGLYGSLTVKVK